ncbi:MAG: type II toxin-antitoxin system VapC family toxin [Planctomycetota bacterium]
MKFWDSSALIVLFVSQGASSSIRNLYADDSEVLAWVLSDVEIRSALGRLEREGALSIEDAHEAMTRVESFWETVHVVTHVEAVKTRAKRLIGVHPLRAADALQLAAALAGCVDDTRGFEFVSLDDRLSDAARREGFTLVPTS